MIQPSHSDAFPYYRKWDLSRLKAALKKGIFNIEGHQVNSHRITPKVDRTTDLINHNLPK